MKGESIRVEQEFQALAQLMDRVVDCNVRLGFDNSKSKGTPQLDVFLSSVRL